VRRLETVQHLARRAGLAIDHLHRAGKPAGQDHVVALGGSTHRVFQRYADGVHPRGFRDFAGCTIDGAVGEHVGDVDGILAAIGDDADAARKRQLADYDLFGGAGLGIDFLDTIIRHVGDVNAILVVDRKIVERRLELRDRLLRAGFRIDPNQLAGLRRPRPTDCLWNRN
jgi:hypothetical protein